MDKLNAALTPEEIARINDPEPTVQGHLDAGLWASIKDKSHAKELNTLKQLADEIKTGGTLANSVDALIAAGKPSQLRYAPEELRVAVATLGRLKPSDKTAANLTGLDVKKIEMAMAAILEWHEGNSQSHAELAAAAQSIDLKLKNHVSDVLQGRNQSSPALG